MRIASVEAIPAGSFCYVRVRRRRRHLGSRGVDVLRLAEGSGRDCALYRAASERCDAFDVEDHWNTLYRALCFRGMAVTGAIAPSTRHVGPQRQAFRGAGLAAPGWPGPAGSPRHEGSRRRAPIDDLVGAARRAVEVEGYGALKVLLFQNEHHLMRQAARIEDLVSRFAAVRETVGMAGRSGGGAAP